MRSVIAVLLTLLLNLAIHPLAMTSPALAAGRVALVVGNAKYQHVPRLANAHNDARAIATMLRGEDFAVEEYHDLSNTALRQVMRNFVTKTRDADVAVVYYAGHGIEVDGINYLIPVDAKLATDLDAQDEALSLERVLQVLDPARRLRLVLLDACRDNPFAAGMKRTLATRAVARGLAQVEPSRPNTLIAFAAKAGSVADDGDANGHSPFTQALLAHLAEPGLDIRLALGRVRDDVVDKTRTGQEPFVYGSLGGDVVTLSAKTMPDAKQMGNQAGDDFGVAQRLGTLEGWDAFLARHGAGLAAELARKERARLAARTDASQPDLISPQSGTAARIGSVLADEDRARVKEIAARKQIPLPDYQIATPSAELDPVLRKFVGVWASRVGYNDGKGRQTMVITTAVEKDGTLRGISLGGPPMPGSPNQSPAFATHFTGQIGTNRFVFYDGVSLQRLELARDGRLLMSTSAPSGTFKVDLEPIWLAADPAAGTGVLSQQMAAPEGAPRFDETARAQINAIAKRNKLPLPDFSFDDAGHITERWRKFAGVWASTNGFNGGSVQAMVIVHSIGDLGDADGYFVVGATPQDQLPARHRPLHGLISDNKMTFVTGRARVEAIWSAGNLLHLRVTQNTGRKLTIDLKPVWVATTGLSATSITAPARNVPQRSRPARQPEAPVSGTERRGGGGNAIFDHPRFSGCARKASQRGMMGPGSGRRQFIRQCVYG